MGTMIARDWIGRATVEGALYDAAKACGYLDEDGETKIRDVIRCGIDAGLAEPHSDLKERNRAETEPPPELTEAIIADLAKLPKRQYAQQVGVAARKYKMTQRSLENLVNDARKEQSKSSASPAIDAVASATAAGDLIHEPDILARFGKAVEEAGLTGETNNAKILYLALTSRLLDKLVSVAVKGVSSGGKSFTVESVLKFFPSSAYFTRTSWSEKAAYYSDEDFRHRFIVLYEAAGGEEETQAYIIRTLLSEGCLKYELVEKTDEGMQSRLIEKEGPTGLITTTTQAKLHPENETRLLSLGIIDTPYQTKAVMRTLATDRAAGFDYAPWQALQEWLATGEQRVSVPFAHFLADAIPPIAVRLRRDFGALLSLIRAHALLHRESRGRDDQGRIVAVVADYKAVHDLVEKLFAESIEATVSAVVRETVVAVAEYIDEHQAPAITLTQLAKELKLDKNSVHHRVRKAITAGYLLNLEEKKGRPARIVLDEPLPAEESLLPAPGTLKNWLEEEKQAYPPEATPTLQHPGESFSETNSYTAGVGVSAKSPLQQSKSLGSQENSGGVGVLEPDPGDIPPFSEKPPSEEVYDGDDAGPLPDFLHVENRKAPFKRDSSDRLVLQDTSLGCKRCGEPATSSEPVVPCGNNGAAGYYHLRCWTEERTGGRSHKSVMTCAHCGRPGGSEIVLSDDLGSIWLHRECEDPWSKRRMKEEGI